MSSIYKLGVIGSPIDHSLSPKIHKIFANDLGLQISYEAIEVKENEFKTAITNLFDQGFMGLNATLPLKEAAYGLADNLSKEAQNCGSVNTLWKEKDTLCADSTDGRGLVKDLESKGIDIGDKNILLLGAGGSAKAVIPSLLKSKPKTLTIANRTPEKAINLANKFTSGECEVNAAAIDARLNSEPSLIINTTSAGTLKQAIELPENLFSDKVFVYDLSYSFQMTPFNKIAKEAGVTNYSDGLGMLIEQAALSFEIWTSHIPSTNIKREDLL